MITQLRNKSNADFEQYHVFYDEYDKPDIRLVPPREMRISISGNRVAMLKRRKANRTAFGSNRRRERIGDFSKSSGFRMAKYLRECVACYRVLGTLTFDNCPTVVEANAAFQKFLKRCKRYFANSPDFSLFWFREFQKRGSIHYHFFCTHYIPSKWLSDSWLACNPTLKKCQTNIKSIGSGRYGTAKYALKYAKKQKQKLLPENVQFAGRWWGKIGNTVVAAAHIDLPIERLNCPVFAPKVATFAAYVEKLTSEGHIFYRDVEITDPKTGERGKIGVEIWELRTGYKLRTLVNLFNAMIDDPEKRLIHQQGWICGKQIRQGGAVRPP